MNTDKSNGRSKELGVIISFLFDNKLKHLIAFVFAVLVSISLYIYDKNNPTYTTESTYEFSHIANTSDSIFREEDFRKFLESLRDKLIATFDFEDYQIKNSKNISGCTSIEILESRLNRFTVVIKSKKGFEIADNCKQNIVNYINNIKKIHSLSHIEVVNNHIRILEESIERADIHMKTIIDYANNLDDNVNPLEYMRQFNLMNQTIPYLELNRLSYSKQMVDFINIKKSIFKDISLVSERKLVIKRYNKNVYFFVFVFFSFLSFLSSIIFKKI